MKKLIAAAAMTCAAITLTACGGGSGKGADSKFFGNVPGIYSEAVAKDNELKDKFKASASEDEARKVMAEAETAQQEYAVKIEEAAKALDGKTIEIESTPQFTVKSPVTLTFDGFASKIDMTPRFKLAGDIVAGENFQSESSKGLSVGTSDLSRYKGLAEPVYLVGLDEAGNKVLESKIASFPMDLISDTELGVKAGTPLTLESFTISDHNMEGCINAVKLQLSYTPDK